MKYAILNKKISLRSWRLVPYAFYYKNSSKAIGLTKEEFEMMRKCDGNTPLRKSKTLDILIQKGYVVECQKGEALSEWSKYKNHNNRYMPMMNLQITGRCNYNCKHCFNAKDNSPLQSEISYEDFIKLLDDCEKCGITSFTITGGEPMIHPQYKQIIEEIYKRNMFVFDLNTNGFYINQEMLDWMKSINYKPLMKISFDGINHHNWMRGYNKAEEKTIEAIKLCIKNNFDVKVQMNVNKENIESIVPSLIMLDKLGVKETRFIKTTDAPRWLENGKEYSMTLEEYYEASLKIVKEYLSSERKMALTGWLLFYINTKEKYFNFIPISCKNDYRESLPLCKGARGMIAVGSNGNVYPCMQSQGYFDKYDIYLGNVFKEGLESILQESEYLNIVTKTLKDRLKEDSDCKKCKYFKYCCGGCPAMSILTSGHYLKEDKSKCLFFKNGYYERFLEAINPEYENMSII